MQNQAQTNQALNVAELEALLKGDLYIRSKPIEADGTTTFYIDKASSLRRVMVSFTSDDGSSKEEYELFSSRRYLMLGGDLKDLLLQSTTRGKLFDPAKLKQLLAARPATQTTQAAPRPYGADATG